MRRRILHAFDLRYTPPNLKNLVLALTSGKESEQGIEAASPRSLLTGLNPSSDPSSPDPSFNHPLLCLLFHCTFNLPTSLPLPPLRSCYAGGGFLRHAPMERTASGMHISSAEVALAQDVLAMPRLVL